MHQAFRKALRTSNLIMQNLPLLSPAAPEEGWVPASRYLSRCRRILLQLNDIEPCDVIEIGSEAGTLPQELAARSFRCSALESLPQALDLAARLASKCGAAVDVRDASGDNWKDRLPLFMALEVLEHIGDDMAALRQWTSWLPTGGALLTSVPAHHGSWSTADEPASHYRRCRSQDLVRGIGPAGLVVEHNERSGFALGNITEHLLTRGIGWQLAANALPADHHTNRDCDSVERNHSNWHPTMPSALGQVPSRGAFVTQTITTSLPWRNGCLLRARKA